jgi:glycosyltransferase involved in cell wall biosynthesis|tara:strand:+ start:1063 stop:1839 length:777 start_codon:yes stop_codon:yes gene_type:complete
MKFSIIVTSYNKGQYLKDCLNSCLNQSIKNYEIIVCDNFSNDNSELIFKEYDGLIKLIKKEKISKIAAVNQIDLVKEGLKISTGEYICLLDGDDYFQANKLKNIKKYFYDNKNLNVIFDVPEIKKNNTFYKFKLKKKYQKNIWPTIINTSSITIKSDFLKKCVENNISNNYDFLEIDFRINVYARCIDKNYKIIPDKLTVYRKIENSIISNIKKFSKIWWIKRLQAHEFMNQLYLKKNLKYKKNNMDYILTKFVLNIL